MKTKKDKKKKFRIKKRVWVAALILLVIGCASCFYYFNMSSKYLKIKLNGKNNIVLNYGEEYTDEGASASYKSKNITNKIEVKTNINLDKIGTYEYTYIIKYNHHTKKVKRKVTIVDKENPTITLIGDSEIVLFKGDTYNEQGAEATDNYDKDLTSEIKITGSVDTNTVGEYTISYEVSDSSNNSANVSRKIIVKDWVTSATSVAVLNYHFFYETQEEYDYPCEHQIICLKMDKFREQLQWLKDNDYKTLTMQEFVDWMYNRIELPEKSVLLTIDDGALGTGTHNGNHLIPALEEYGAHATLFLITGWWDIANYQSSNLEVESHTHDLHYYQDCGYSSKVNCVGYENLVEDLKKSIERTNSTLSFCYPYYEYSDESIQAVKDVGFQVAFAGGGRKATRNDNKYTIPRYVIYDSISLQEFINMVS